MYYSLNKYLKEKYGEKVWKVPVDAGFSCPNKTANSGGEGCIYCDTASFTHVERGEIADQVKKRIEKLRRRKINKFIIYFQSGTNTYGDIQTVKSRINSSLIDEDIVGIHIGTRPDCVDESILGYLSELNEKYDVTIEYGLQSAKNSTLKFINRGHSAEEFARACKRTKAKGISVCAHIILGLPGESRRDMIETADFVAGIGIDSIKFHHLQVLKNTKLAELYREKKFNLLSQEEYVDILSQFIARLQPDVVISRLIGDSPEELLIAPEWPSSKSDFVNKLNKFMEKNNLYQGKLYTG
ncbi:TIGR01212 family radical SAM protein [Flexistipes sp.]|uniref:TIGR01212 family radical SAM protein n=1 Tax=Flexistipes sp. TaxID=3088135 RepID=UPI002E1D6248|nr:TIGR01212 family radical SAM protein [Flexistipes sp.]MEC9492362.1 TIGR01212 family radical SAM protein [Flexistipes sp.]